MTKCSALAVAAASIQGLAFGARAESDLRDDDDVDQYPIVPVPPIPFEYPLSSEHWPEELKQQRLWPWPTSSYSSTINNGVRLGHSPSGTFPNQVLLLCFADHVSRELPTRDEISRLYNSEDADIDDGSRLRRRFTDDITPTGSVRQVDFVNSHSALTVDTTVIDWITLPETEAYYATGERGLSKSKFKEAMIEGLTRLDDGEFDFGAFDLDVNGNLDGFGVLHSGYGAEFGGDDCYGTDYMNRIWSHKGGLKWTSGDGGVEANRYYVSSALRGKCKSNIVRMGVLCHELGHYLGLPDLYDSTFHGSGLGAYGFMSQSWGLDGSGLYPPNLSAWSKLQLGWATAEVIEADGTYELEASTPGAYRVHKIHGNFPQGEYLLLENRQPFGYDSKISQGGIAIYHIDERAEGQRYRGFPSQAGWPENGHHYTRSRCSPPMEVMTWRRGPIRAVTETYGMPAVS